MSDTRAIIQQQVNAGEKILWYGQPGQGVTFRPADAFLIPLQLFVCGFAICWESTVLTEEAPTCFALLGIPFVLIALYGVAGRFFVDAKRREKTHYALTDERILIISDLFGRNTKSLNLKILPEINLNEKKNGDGTIYFAPSHPMASLYAGVNWWPPHTGRFTPPSFENIEHANLIYDLIRKAQREAWNQMNP